MDTNEKKVEEIEWGGYLNEFLWICAGVNRKVLRQCPTDYAKYAGIGGTILFTALMASLSGGYALNSVFDNEAVAICFGVFWGLLIFNLDRFIVNTMYSDGKVTISWREFYCGLPRIIMAIFLGIVISTPLELKIFEDAIDIRIEQDKDDLIRIKIGGTIQERDSIAQKKETLMTEGVHIFDSGTTTANVTTNRLLAEIESLDNKIDVINRSIKDLDSQISPLRNKLGSLSPNDPGRDGISNKLNDLLSKRNRKVSERARLASNKRDKQGQAAASDGDLKRILDAKQKETEKECERLQKAVDSLNVIISEANVRHKNWTKEQIKEKGSFRDKLDVEYKGFQAKMKAFSGLKDDSSSTYISSLFIMLLFIIIETAPTFFKMMIASGPYDDLLRSEMHKVRVLSDKRISDLNDDINTEVRISVEKNKDRLEAELAANKELMERIAKVQAELLQTAIAEWREAEMAKIKENPSAYIKKGENQIG